MITLQGILRQSGEMKINEKPLVKLWIEHETPRENGVADLKIEELFIDHKPGMFIPKKGETINLQVRAYPSGRDVKFQALGILNLATAKA